MSVAVLVVYLKAEHHPGLVHRIGGEMFDWLSLGLAPHLGLAPLSSATLRLRWSAVPGLEVARFDALVHCGLM